jgi:hypothetical protein
MMPSDAVAYQSRSCLLYRSRAERLKTEVESPTFAGSPPSRSAGPSFFTLFTSGDPGPNSQKIDRRWKERPFNDSRSRSCGFTNLMPPARSALPSKP